MKFLFAATIFSLAMIASCSFSSNKKRFPASVMKDVGVKGPNGEVLLYYKEGDYIIVKNCDPNTILGSTPDQARQNCKGRSSKVSVESFKAALRHLVSVDNLYNLRPLTPIEVRAYDNRSPYYEDIDAQIEELDKINDFIKNYGEEDAKLVRKEELEKALDSHKDRARAIKKINAEVEKAISLITDQSKLAMTKFRTDKHQFLYTVLKNFDPTKKYPCGLSGSVKERIQDCSLQEGSVNGDFVLVTRTQDFIEVHKDRRSGLLWGDRIVPRFFTKNALFLCQNQTYPGGANIKAKWRIPTIDEFKTAEMDGIRKALPNILDYYLSSTPDTLVESFGGVTRESKVILLFDGDTGKIIWGDLNYTVVGTRCVALDDEL